MPENRIAEYKDGLFAVSQKHLMNRRFRKMLDGNARPCSCHDERCIDVDIPSNCFSGRTNIDGKIFYSEPADGYCPRIH